MDLKYKFNFKEYSAMLGISPSALRKRRLAGKLEGQYIKKGSDYLLLYHADASGPNTAIVHGKEFTQTPCSKVRGPISQGTQRAPATTWQTI